MPHLGPLRICSADAAGAASATPSASGSTGRPRVPVDPDAGVPTRSMARLLIHAGSGAGHGVLARVLLRLRRLASEAVRRRAAVCTRLRIDDLAGRRFFATDDARSTIDLPLPAGTYQVDVWLGDRMRRYTVTLQHGVTVDLTLRPDSGSA